MAGRVDGKIALVTGAGSGLGRATAKLLAAEGAMVIATDINPTTAQETVDMIGGNARALEQDVADEGRWAEVIADIADTEGALHVLVHNAGIGHLGTVEDTDLADWRRVHAIDVDSVFMGTKAALGLMKKTKGSIVTISSIAGILADHNLAAYNSAKAAVRHLSKSIALHCTRQGYDIRCNSVHPAFCDTPILDGITPDYSHDEIVGKLGARIPMGRVGSADDVAYAVLYLASEESGFMTGAELVLDGGLSAL